MSGFWHWPDGRMIHAIGIEMLNIQYWMTSGQGSDAEDRQIFILNIQHYIDYESATWKE